MQPYILVIGEPDSYTQCFLVTDGQIVFEIEKVQNIPLILLAAYFAFNIQYPDGCKNFYAFLEVVFLNVASSKVAASVKHVLSALS